MIHNYRIQVPVFLLMNLTYLYTESNSMVLQHSLMSIAIYTILCYIIWLFNTGHTGSYGYTNCAPKFH